MPGPSEQPAQPEAMRIIALFGPTGVGKTAIAVALAGLLRERGEDPVAVSADALQVYSGLEALTGVASPSERVALEHRMISFLPLDATFNVAEYAELAHAEIDSLLKQGRRPIVVGGTGLYLRAALADLDLRPAPPEGAREHWTAQLQRHGAPTLHAELARRAPWAAEGLSANDARRVIRALEALEAGGLEPPEGPSQLWSEELRHPTLLAGLTMEREALYAQIDQRVEAILAAGAREEVRRAQAAGASETARKALGYEELLAGDVETMKRRTRNYARRQLSWMRKMAGVLKIDVGGREPSAVAVEILRLRRRMRFEKWQALGNDYLIVERDRLAFELSPARIRRLCEGHFGVFADGLLLLSDPADPEHVADLRIFNPDGSEAELSGNGAREAILYLRRRGWTELDEFSIHTAAGTIRPRITGEFSCRVDMGQASLCSHDFPSGPPDGAAELRVEGNGGREQAAGSGRPPGSSCASPSDAWSFQHVSIGNPQCAIAVADLAQLGSLDLPAIGPAIEGHAEFPNRTNVSWYAEIEPKQIAPATATTLGGGLPRIQARIFERGVGETLSSGTGASGAAIAYLVSGRAGRAPGPPSEPASVIVQLDGGELEVEVDPDLRVHLSGWALPVFAGELSERFVAELREIET